jgi:hypothetical protein
MSHSRPIHLVAVSFLAAIVVACSGAASSGSLAPTAPSSGSPPASTGPSAAPSAPSSPAASAAGLLLKVTSEGGFINPAATLAALPTVAVYADGRIMTPGPVDAIYPGPLLTPVSVRDVGPSGAAAILAAIKQVGLDRPASADPGVPGDSGTNVFTAVVDGATTTSRFAGAQPGHPGGPVASGDEEGAAALALLDRLLDPGETWGAPAATETRYVPAGYRVYVAPGAPQADPQASQSPVAWPLATPLAEFGTAAVPDRGITGLRQGVVLGADAATLGPVLEQASMLTAFTSGGSSYTLSVRPLLPDEVGG